MNSSKTKTRKRAWRDDIRNSALVVGSLIVIGVLIIVLSGDDHDRRCEQKTFEPLFHFRPIESREYGTPAGTAYSRRVAGRAPHTYWTNDTTPVDVTDALCEPSLDFFDPSNPTPHRLTNTLFAFFGQFIAHSFALQQGDIDQAPVFSHLARNFPGVRPSLYVLDGFGKQQINTLDPYLAASAVYGHLLSTSDSLRKLDGTGRLRMSNSPYHSGELLVLGDDGNFTAGDVRVRENHVLTSMHTLFAREHNYWAARLALENPTWGEDTLFHTARHIVIGEIQSITYNEWLPTLLNKHELLRKKPCLSSSIRLTTRNEMATGALRMGHSLIPNQLDARDPGDGTLIPSLEVSFMNSFMQSHNSSSVYLYDIDTYLLGALYQPAEFLDTLITGVLMAPPSTAAIFNLGGFNVARGRDHNLPSYQDAFTSITGKPFRSIRKDITHNPKLAEALEAVYNNGEDPIDLWIGILSERKREGSMMGVVGRYIIAEQFAFMRNADPYYYEWDKVVAPWKEQIHATRIVDVIQRNTAIEEGLLQGRSFFH